MSTATVADRLWLPIMSRDKTDITDEMAAFKEQDESR